MLGTWQKRPDEQHAQYEILLALQMIMDTHRCTEQLYIDEICPQRFDNLPTAWKFTHRRFTEDFDVKR